MSEPLAAEPGYADTPAPASQEGGITSSASAGAREVAGEATTQAKAVAGEAAQQAKAVAGEARRQLDHVVEQTRSEVRQQAEQRAERAASGLRGLGDQLQALADGRTESAGPLVGYLEDARSRVSSVADRIEQGGPQAVLDDVASFARRRPVAFLAAAAAAGFMVGRLARAGKEEMSSGSSTPSVPGGQATGSWATGAPSTGAVPSTGTVAPSTGVVPPTSTGLPAPEPLPPTTGITSLP